MANPIWSKGVRDIIIFPVTKDETPTSLATYGSATQISGIVTANATIEKTEEVFYASSKKYADIKTDLGYTGTLTLTGLDKKVYADMVGLELDGDNVGWNKAGSDTKRFALTIQSQGEPHDWAVQFFNVKFSKPSIELETATDSSNIKSLNIEFSAFPRAKDNYTHALASNNPDNTKEQAKYNAMMTSVLMEKTA